MMATFESFDSVVAPSLPVGWTQSTTNTNNWITVSGGNSDSAPNHAFVANPGSESDSILMAPSFVLTQANGRLSFQNNYDTEFSWDGGVLEISVNGGSFADIETAGGVFISGRYNGLLNNSNNPLANRQAWNGNSNGYVTTVIDLPYAAYNQNVVLRWRFGSDEFANEIGWRIDTILLNSAPPPPTDDFGDAPIAAQSGFASSYPTFLADGGAHHTLVAGFHLGALADIESDGLPNLLATGDDLSPSVSDDEDGVNFDGPFSIGSIGAFNVTLTNTASLANPYLDAWVDFNRDGDWNDSGERVFSQVISGNTAISFIIPPSIQPGNSYARIRLHSGTTPLSPGGAASNGEVEDYRIQFTVLGKWLDQGPSPTVNGQITNVQPNNQINGAIHTVLAHPTNPDVLFVGGVNGGIWKTTNATSVNPNWVPQTDQLDSLSIGALAFDRTDATRNTLVAGTAQYSSFGGLGGTRGSVYRTTDGGTTWVNPGSVGLQTVGGENISGIAARGNTIVVSSSANTGGIFRSTNAGATFVGINSGGIVVNDNVFDLVEDLSDPIGNRLYAAVEDEAIYRSNDFGLTWTAVSSPVFNAEMNALITDPRNNNIEMAIHPTTGRLYVAVLLSGQPRGIFYSDNASTAAPTWTRMDVPVLPIGNGVAITDATNATPIMITSSTTHGLASGQFVAVNGVVGNTATNGIFTVTVINATQFSLNGSVGNGAYVSGGVWTPVVTPNPISKDIDETGAQGRIHFSIVVDPTDHNIVYIGGDRQEQPNAIGDVAFNAAIFRGNATIPRNPTVAPSPQWDHITHNIVGFDLPGGTASGSAPHADSREMVFDANGNLIETDDGGIYKRTNPRNNTGDWFSLVGNIGVFEIHDVAYDNLSDTLFIGTQDNGTHYQPSAGSQTFQFLQGGDGGDVAVNNITLASNGQSIRYSSSQNLGNFARTVWNASGGLIAASFPALALVSGSAFVPAFRTPVELNAINPTRLILQGNNSAYESFDQGESIFEVSPGAGAIFVDQNAIAYGGKQNGIDNANVLWVGSFNSVSVRTSGTGPTALTSAQPAGASTIRDLTIDPDDWASAFIVDSNKVFATSDIGATWSNITGNLPVLGNVFWSIKYVPSAISDAIVVGTNHGVFAMMTSSPGVWVQLGANLPHAAIFDLDYSRIDDVLVAGTLGRGAWLLPNASDAINADTIAPSTVSFKRKLPLTQVTNADMLVFSANFSEGVLGVDANDFIVTGTTASISVTQMTQSSYNLTISGGNLASLNASVGINFAASPTITDIAGNALPNTEPIIDETYAVVNPLATIQQSYIFYNESNFETVGGVAAAIDNSSKQLLQSSNVAQATTFANVTNYSRGINGLVFDVNNLAATTLSTSDFIFRRPTGLVSGIVNPSTWANAPTPSIIDVTPGSPSRVRIEWLNSTIQDTWLQVILKSNANTGLGAPLVFYIGNAAGELNGLAPYRVGTPELSTVQTGVSSELVPITDARDIDKSRRVGTTDLSFVQARVSSTIRLDNIIIPIAGSAEEGASPPPQMASLRIVPTTLAVSLSGILSSLRTPEASAYGSRQSRFPSIPSMPVASSDAAMSRWYAESLASLENSTLNHSLTDFLFTRLGKKKFGRT
ncbi:MAG: GEVED domain-containing protein [Pirellulaceae bacterium]|nr:GEVED domain-containing protein [Pirellulaceae bacterium]